MKQKYFFSYYKGEQRFAAGINIILFFIISQKNYQRNNTHRYPFFAKTF